MNIDGHVSISSLIQLFLIPTVNWPVDPIGSAYGPKVYVTDEVTIAEIYWHSFFNNELIVAIIPMSAVCRNIVFVSTE